MPAYVASMGEKEIKLTDVPMRIVQRYIGNIQHMTG